MAAIYMWFQTYEEVYTTTLYPLEVSDALLMSVNLGSDNYFAPIDYDALKLGTEMIGGTLLVQLLAAPEQNDKLQFYTEMVSGTLVQLLLSAPEQTDSLKFYTELISGTLDTLLVTTYMPDNGVIMSVNLVPGSCSMTGV